MISEVYFNLLSTEPCSFPKLSSNAQGGKVTYYTAMSLFPQ